METRTTDLAPVGKRNPQREAVVENLQYLTFNLAGESYGVDILKVQEIRGWVPVTKVPNAPVFVRGVMNLRGAIVPVVDLRLRFGLESVEYTKITVVIVVTVHAEQGDRIIGMVVDGVSDVLNINNAADIKEAPNFGAAASTEFINGLVALDSGMVMLLDVDRLLSVEEMFSLETMRSSSSQAMAHAS
ncbi:MAG: purine-binding chemotaxis protein CheW [Gammaproteobacteria bacterium]|nr:purine-binding chemotaxis protein CheW [Gammaproteobacteria bacterium]MCP5196339.1 purine-binding chemotaxis protein CheW [Gammaproteobacteria bacterium]